MDRQCSESRLHDVVLFYLGGLPCSLLRESWAQCRQGFLKISKEL